jgi:glycosyltransferase involved in cell wall biosynthesis
MHKAYEKSHIVLVPTMYAEGTSLSCIEAMATNNGIIATTIGGLPNLINHRYNGLLIKPSADEIIKSVEFLINNRDILKTFAKNAIESSSSLNKRYWLESWSSIIEQNVSFKPAGMAEKRGALINQPANA